MATSTNTAILKSTICLKFQSLLFHSIWNRYLRLRFVMFSRVSLIVCVFFYYNTCFKSTYNLSNVFYARCNLGYVTRWTRLIRVDVISRSVGSSNKWLCDVGLIVGICTSRFKDLLAVIKYVSLWLKTSSQFPEFPAKFPETWKVSTAKFPEKFGNSRRKTLERIKEIYADIYRLLQYLL